MKTFFALLPAFIFISPLRAQVTPHHAHEGSAKLERVEVVSERNKNLTVPSLDEARLDLLRTPGGVEVIAAARFNRGRVSTVNDVFALSAGVFAQSRFGSDEARLSIRGSGLQRTFHGRGLRILQDGVPLNLADGSFDMQAFEALSAVYINVWRGANALAYGASTLGGAIEFISHTGRDAGPRLLRVEAGSFAYRRAQLAGGGVRGPIDAYASFTHTAQEGFRTHAGQENERLFANAGYRLADDLEMRVFVTAVTTDSELPGSLFQSEVKSSPQAANPMAAAQNHQRDFDLLRLANKTTWRAGDLVWDFSLAWTYKNLDHPISPIIDQLSNDPLAALTATYVGTVAGRTHRLRAGAMWTHNTVQLANYANLSGTRGALLTQADHLATNTELWIEDQLTLIHGITLVLGSTFAVNRRVNQPEFGGSGSYAHTYQQASPKLGLRWDRGEVQVYANVSRSYEPPSFSEAGTLAGPIRAQTATTFELGTRGLCGPLRWDASVYSAQLRDEFLSLNDANGNPLGTINAPRTHHAGVEFSGEMDLLGQDLNTTFERRLVLRMAWTYGRFRFDDDPVYRDNALAGFPPHWVHGELTWENRQGWYAGPNLKWVPRRAPVDFAHTLFTEPYVCLGFRVGQRLPEGFSWFAEIRNAFDRHYVATTGVIADAKGLDQRQFLPGDGRACYLGVEHRW